MITKTKIKTKCNVCHKESEFNISVKKQKKFTKINLCKECLTDLYFEISKIITPKSPQNILNNFKR